MGVLLRNPDNSINTRDDPLTARDETTSESGWAKRSWPNVLQLVENQLNRLDVHEKQNRLHESPTCTSLSTGTRQTEGRLEFPLLSPFPKLIEM